MTPQDSWTELQESLLNEKPRNQRAQSIAVFSDYDASDSQHHTLE